VCMRLSTQQLAIGHHSCIMVFLCCVMSDDVSVMSPDVSVMSV